MAWRHSVPSLGSHESPPCRGTGAQDRRRIRPRRGRRAAAACCSCVGSWSSAPAPEPAIRRRTVESFEGNGAPASRPGPARPPHDAVLIGSPRVVRRAPRYADGSSQSMVAVLPNQPAADGAEATHPRAGLSVRSWKSVCGPTTEWLVAGRRPIMSSRWLAQRRRSCECARARARPIRVHAAPVTHNRPSRLTSVSILGGGRFAAAFNSERSQQSARRWAKIRRG
jgi:hypothetical protein